MTIIIATIGIIAVAETLIYLNHRAEREYIEGCRARWAEYEAKCEARRTSDSSKGKS